MKEFRDEMRIVFRLKKQWKKTKTGKLLSSSESTNAVRLMWYLWWREEFVERSYITNLAAVITVMITITNRRLMGVRLHTKSTNHQSLRWRCERSVSETASDVAPFNAVLLNEWFISYCSISWIIHNNEKKQEGWLPPTKRASAAKINQYYRLWRLYFGVFAAILEIFNVKEWPNLEIWVWGPSRSLKKARFDKPCVTFY